ncbi:MAG: hypothetical protein DRO11_02710 [Methanobacteriota archaeon]|nr:MAG: hypothetical protein DRO11_02710 [Euryarchaeota archaeon]
MLQPGEQGKKRVVTLTTDLGVSDWYVGAMKGVITSICPETTIVDITHEIPRHSIETAAFVVSTCFQWFPPKTIHIVLVDPGVGTERKAILLEANKHIFLAPDNGVLTYILDKDVKKVYEITNTGLMLPNISKTFHGRDIFAPVAAHLARGVPTNQVGPELSKESLVQLNILTPRVDRNTLLGAIIHIDTFGNIITNMPGEWIKKVGEAPQLFHHSTKHALRRVETYNDHSGLLLLVGSHGYLEIAVAKGSAAAKLGANVGEPCKIVWRG